MDTSDKKSNCGKIQIIIGPMFSGKTSELLRRIRRFHLANKKCLVIKYIKDTRYNIDDLTTHDRQTCNTRPVFRLGELKGEITDTDIEIVGIDEGQFFPDLVEFAEEMASKGKTVIISALDGTFQRKPFGSVLELIPMAEDVIKLSAVCRNCGADAAFSRRLTDETKIEIIGGADKYVAVCRRCFHLSELSNNKDSRR